MGPSTQLTTLRPDLGGSFMEYDLTMLELGFIAGLALPVFESMTQTGPFGRIKLASLLQNREDMRAPGANYQRGSYEWDKDSFATDEHGLEEPADDREAEMYGGYFDLELHAAERARSMVLLNAEKRAADLLFNTTTWTGSPLTTAVSVKWDVPATATPRADVKAAMIAVWNSSGLWPNALIINHLVFQHLIDTAEIVDRLKYSGHVDPRPSNISPEAAAQALGVQRILVAGSPRNTAAEGAAAVIGPVWASTMAMVARVATRPRDIKEPCVGRTIHWTADGSSIGGTVESYREENARSTILRVRQDVQEKLLHKEGAHLLTNIT